MDLKLPNSASSTHQRLETIKTSGYELDFSETFGDAFNVYKKIALTAGGALLVAIIVIAALVLGLIAITAGIAFVGDLANTNLEDVSFMYIAGYFIIISVASAAMVPFLAGIIQMAYDVDHGREVEFSTAFKFYSHPAFKDLFLSGLVLAAISAVFSIGFQVLHLQVIGLLLSSIVTFLTILTVPLIIFGKLNFSDAILGSVAVVAKSPLIILGLLLVSILFAMAGFIALCIGYLFTAPIVYAMYYSIYKKSVGFNHLQSDEN